MENEIAQLNAAAAQSAAENTPPAHIQAVVEPEVTLLEGLTYTRSEIGRTGLGCMLQEAALQEFTGALASQGYVMIEDLTSAISTTGLASQRQ